jgi:hypothetical protein
MQINENDCADDRLDSISDFTANPSSNSLYRMDDLNFGQRTSDRMSEEIRRSQRISESADRREQQAEEKRRRDLLTIRPIKSQQAKFSACRSKHNGLPCAAISANHAPGYYNSFRVK